MIKWAITIKRLFSRVEGWVFMVFTHFLNFPCNNQILRISWNDRLFSYVTTSCLSYTKNMVD